MAESKPRPHDSAWWKPASGCPSGTFTTDRLCIACDIVHGPAACLTKCDAGDGAACTLVGTFYELGQFNQTRTASDGAMALDFYQRACALRSADGCMALASKTMAGHDIAKDETAALALFHHLCEERHAPACRAEGVALINGGNRGDGLALVKRACDLADRVACRMTKDADVLESVDEAQRKASWTESKCRRPEMRDSEPSCLDAIR